MATFRQSILVLVTLSIFGYVCYIGIKNVFRYNVLSRDQESVLKEVITAKRERQLLKSEMALSLEKDYWNYLSKQHLGYVHSNESVYYIHDQ